MDSLRRRAIVIDLASFRRTRTRAELPLFARPLQREPGTVAPFRPLTPRELQHRGRMLAHLTSQ